MLPAVRIITGEAYFFVPKYISLYSPLDVDVDYSFHTAFPWLLAINKIKKHLMGSYSTKNIHLAPRILPKPVG